MTIKTLSFIHAQLIHAADKAENVAQIGRDAYYQAESEGAANAAALKERYNSLRQAAYDARCALREFEEKEW